MTVTDALVAALAGEHAAIFAYGVLGVRLDRRTVADARAAEAAHRDRRDALLLRLDDAEVTPPAPAASYELPFRVTDKETALQLAIGVEDRTAMVWRAALGQATGADRRLALDALTDCAVRATRFRRAAGVDPVTVAFPGRAN